MGERQKPKGKHRAENEIDGKSTSERITGKRDDASKSQHNADKRPKTGETK
jgi:hypothetical protein